MANKDTSTTAKTKPTAKKGKSTAAKGSSPSSSKKPTSEIRILSAIAQQHAIGTEFACRKQVATIANMPKEGSYNTIVNIMKRKGLVVSSDDKKGLKVTEEGYAKLGPEAAAMPKTNEDVHANLKQMLKAAKARDMFDLLADGRPHSHAELAQSIGYVETDGSFKTYVGSLSKYTDKAKGPDGSKVLQLKDMAFPFGRPNTE